MTPPIVLLTVGKNKSTSHLEIETNFKKRLGSFLQVIEEKGDQKDRNREGRKVSETIRKYKEEGRKIILLDEKGKVLSSEALSQNIFSKQKPNILFVVGGAHGFTQEVYDLSDEMFSLSKMTLPHKFARLLIIEQIYRAKCINENHPYHHE